MAVNAKGVFLGTKYAIPEMRRLITDGVDGLFTNYPGRLRRLLATMFPPV